MQMQIGKRIIVVGTSGSGKTTLAKSIADILDISHIELDALYWEADWTETPDDIFIQKIEDALDGAGQTWIIDGNYRRSRPIIWHHADTIIWLDYPLRIILWRLVSRTFRRVFLRVELWNGNRERFCEQFFSDDSIFRWAFQTYHRRKRTYTELMQNNKYPNLKFIHFAHPRETEKWLKQLASQR
jgi:adenylate kinase family enzyme